MNLILTILSFALVLSANDYTNKPLPLNKAIEILKSKNLEIKVANLEEKSAKKDEQTVSGKNWGKLDFTQDFARSNDAGNVFGFKLTSREATFGDFGAREFMDATGANNGIPPESAYTNPPHDLNYPNDRNFFQSKLKYEVPLFTGFALTNYSKIMSNVSRIKKLEKSQVVNEKVYQLRKSYYDMALLNDSIKHLNIIIKNIDTLEDTTQNMIDVGYAKKVDLLEVKAKKGNVTRVLVELNANKKLLYHYISFLLNKDIKQITPPSSPIALPQYNDDTIIKNNLDIKKATTALAIKNDMLSVSKAAYYPTVGAFAEIGTADDSFLGNTSKHKAYTVGARLSWNVFNGSIDSAKIEKAKIENLKMQSKVLLAKKGIKLKLARLRTQIESADEKIVSLEKELILADAIYENYEGRYKEKLSSMSDVIIKQSAQIEKILQLLVAKNERNEKIFALERLANIQK